MSPAPLLAADLALLDAVWSRLGTAQLLREIEIREREAAKACGLKLEMTKAADCLERAAYVKAALNGIDGMGGGKA